jgi:thymidylate synthase
MKQYLDALRYVLEHGEKVSDRTGVGTRSVFGYQMRFDLQQGFPAVTTKRLAWRAVVGELLWFLEGSTDERRLAEITFDKDVTEITNKSTIWTANANKQGADLGYINTEFKKGLGPIYGYQWRNFNKANGSLPGNLLGTDQISWLIQEIKRNPDSRRLILTAWNPNQLEYMALPPCHVLAQFRVYNNKLSCQLYQRSGDAFLGIPFNISSYALLTHILAKICGLGVGELIHTIGDLHIYENHIAQVEEQITRQPRELPNIILPVFCDIETLMRCKVSDFILINYDPMPSIKAPMAV